MKNITYREAGVDIDAGDELVTRIGPAVQSTHRKEVLAGVGGFASLVSIPAGYREPILVSGTDGVGKKLKIAFAMGEHRTVGIDLVAMCVNDVLTTGAEPLFFLDYYACSSLDPTAAASVIAGIAEGCRQAGCALVGGETAELPGFYQKGEYDLAGFAVGVVERSRMVTGERVKPGDAVIGLSSSGLHSNGYSLVRAILENKGICLADSLPGTNENFGAALLKPTRIYAGPVRALLAAVDVRAMAHITGGGLIENIPRTLPLECGVLLKSGWPIPPIFDWLRAAGPVAPAEMLRTFNMGIGMTIVVPPAEAKRAQAVAIENGAPAQVIGRVVAVAPSANRVAIEGAI